MSSGGCGRFSFGEKLGAVALVAGFLLLPILPTLPYLAIIPFALFLFICLLAPFCSRFGFFLPVISSGKRGATGMALTFDDGPSPASTPAVLELLARYNLQATFFLIGKNAVQYPELVADIANAGHTIANHSWSHDYFLMLRSTKRIAEDIGRTQQALQKYAPAPRFFRPPVGITGPRLKAVLEKEQLLAVSINCRAYDRGNRNVEHLAEKIIRRLRPGCIIMLHDLPPYDAKNGEAEYTDPEKRGQWRGELQLLFAELQRRGNIVPLEELIS